MKSLHVYFVGTASWYLSYGIQSVAFAWLVTIVLNESPSLVGIAQMALLLPALLIMLVGGSLADHFGGRRIAMLGHLLASIAPLFLTIVVLLDKLTYAAVLVFALIMGIAQALVTPARDGLLALVADGAIQRRVLQVSMIQFGVQMLGFLAASFADTVGAAAILMTQCCFLMVGAFAYFKLEIHQPRAISVKDNFVTHMLQSIAAGYRSVRQSPSMGAIVLQNCAMGLFFMGSYIVTLPLLVRELYEGTSAQLSWMNAANSLGLVMTIMVLLRVGDLHRQGRALIVAQLIGCVALGSGALGLGFGTLMLSVFLWGLCGGMSMTMARTIMQEQSAPDQRARMMAFFSFSFMGSGPLGALFSGIMVDLFGAQIALATSSTLMFIVVLVVMARSSLWQMDGRHIVSAEPVAGTTTD